MLKLIGKLRITIVISFIMLVLSISWIVLDYYVLKNLFADNTILNNYEHAILVISLAVFAALIVTILFNLYYGLRVSIKVKSEINKAKKINSSNINSHSTLTESK